MQVIEPPPPRPQSAQPSSPEAASAAPPTAIMLPPEPYVDANAVAAFLSLRRPEVLKLTREGKIRGYAYRGQQRHVYRYRLSEVARDFAALATPPSGKILPAAPVSHRRKSNG